MKAYHNKPELKQMMVEEAIKHRVQQSVKLLELMADTPASGALASTKFKKNDKN